MGRKSNKRGSGKSNKAKSNNDAADKPPAPSADKQPSKAKSLYSIYKYCTDTVIDWGRTTYEKLKGGKLPRAPSLSVVVLECLAYVLERNVPMPDSVLEDLRTAINYRKRVGEFYRSIPSASEESYAQHQWLIVQLELLEQQFANINENKKQPKKKSEKSAKTVSPQNMNEQLGFQLLSLSDEEDEAAEADASSGEKKPRRKVKEEAPTDEELEAEERTFAISLVLTEISEAREDLKELWRQWASKKATGNEDAAAELLGVTACTEYTVYAISKFFDLSTVEYPSFFESFNLQVLAESIRENQETPRELRAGECVTIRKLEKRPELNGKSGKITKELDGRFGVAMFPDDCYEQNAKQPILSIKAENLLRSNNPFICLAQIEKALESFSFDACPPHPEWQGNSQVPPELHKTNLTMLSRCWQFEKALENGDFGGFLQLVVKYILPIWVTFARYCLNSGAADTVLTAYLREFAETRQIRFHLSLAIMVAIDGAFVSAEVDQHSSGRARDLYKEILSKVYQLDTYKRAFEIINRKKLNKAMNCSHYVTYYETTRHYQHTFHPMCLYFPWFSGEMLQSGLRLHLLCGIGFAFKFCQTYTVMIHLYWMLRTQGYLGRINEIEAAFIRVYRQQVWFRGGIPQKGSGTYLKSWQLAIGMNVHGARLLGGQPNARSVGIRAAQAFDRTGHSITEISQLQAILQWKSMPISNRKACYEQIQQIAREEYLYVFTAPLMSACCNLSDLFDSLGKVYANTAQSACLRMLLNFASVSRELNLNDTSVVCFWGLSLADNRALNKDEKKIGLSMLAKSFKDVFEEDPGEDKGIPTLTFNPNDHEVDPSLWGLRGVFHPGFQLVPGGYAYGSFNPTAPT
ncbi:expressed unknown protein [Seminavis robusta]|uniref:DUF6604 domain-containing protein n=1 Tax=Seminavis robusta TaxID=568900 RepID=A0A9N8DMM1_9STRA|nr:expressed unknown protein [Seminavis robusta]|eukprot:Sro244_g097140.1 n/a (863) ;mRNA; r:24348-26936